MKEKDLVRVVKDYLDYQELLGNLYYIRNNTGAVNYHGRYLQFGKRGSSDFIVFLPVRKDKNSSVLFIEAKSENGKASMYQLEFADRIKRLGYEYHIVRSLDELMAIIGHKD